jgi:hypothetical protein
LFNHLKSIDVDLSYFMFGDKPVTQSEKPPVPSTMAPKKKSKQLHPNRWLAHRGSGRWAFQPRLVAVEGAGSSTTWQFVRNDG